MVNLPAGGTSERNNTWCGDFESTSCLVESLCQGKMVLLHREVTKTSNGPLSDITDVEKNCLIVSYRRIGTIGKSEAMGQ